MSIAGERCVEGWHQGSGTSVLAKRGGIGGCQGRLVPCVRILTGISYV